MEISFDRNRCAGHAQCNAAAPNVFPLDDRAYCDVPDTSVVPEGLEEQARAGADACPEHAIAINVGAESPVS